MGLFKRLKQITGDLPIKRKHLGQYSHKVDFMESFTMEGDLEYSNAQRINTDIFLNVYKTNSAKISFEDRLKKQEFHLVDLPIHQKGYEIYKVVNDKRVKFLISISKSNALICMNGTSIGTKFINK